MAWLSIFKRKTDAAPAPGPNADPGDAVQLARTRARQRLVGAVVLVVIGVIGFPLVFETQPRPIPVDIPIEIPRKEGAPPLVMPSVRGPAPGAPTAAPAAKEDVITESRSEAGREIAPAASAGHAGATPAAPKVAEKSVDVPDDRTVQKPADKPVVKPSPEARPLAATRDSERAKALLDGKDAPVATDGGRFVVQVGAFSDAAAAREMRQKVEKLGLKTYTQVAETASGSRIRVRVGPFASREEADKALAKARAAGVAAVVLTL